MKEPEELDELLSDIQKLLDESPDGKAPPKPEGPGTTRVCYGAGEGSTPEVKPWEQPGYTGAYYGPEGARPVFGASAAPPQEAPLQPRLRNEQAERFAVPERRLPAQAPPAQRPPAPPAEKPKKKRHIARNTVLILLLLLLAVAVLTVVLARQPVSGESRGERKPGVSTILLAGVDEGGERTDTLILMTADREKGRISLVSIPRDTLIQGPYRVPKINGVYGVNGGGEEGINMLLQRVGECIGFRPDGYMLIGLEGFQELVDTMGGVEFDVPQDMYYDDPAQNLHIALNAGKQTLDGEQAMGLVRFRSGYSEADIQRVSVQRDFLTAAARQWFSPKLLLKALPLLRWSGKYVETDLSTSNLIWLALALYGGRSDMTADVLPGKPAYIQGGAYYVLDPPAVAELINRRSNPFQEEISWTELNINY